MQDPIRLIVLDMDGTLLYEPCLEIPPINVAALREAHAQGVQLALCSGRMPDDAGLFAVHAGLPMHILALNGACCLSGALGEITHSTLIPPEVMARLMPVLKESQLCLGLFREHELLVTHPPEDDDFFCRLWGTHALSPEGRCKVYRGPEELDSFAARGVSKIVVLEYPEKGTLPVLRQALEVGFPELEVASSWSGNIEINLRGVNKGAAVTALAAQLGIPIAQVMAVGDNDNDLPMLRVAGVAVAMGNATPAAMACAHYTTLTCKEHGAAAAVRALVLGEKVPGVYKR